MTDISRFEQISPYVRMMRIKKEASLSGKWRDMDHVFTYIAAGSADFILNGIRYQLCTGDAILIPPYMTHMIISNGAEPLIQYILHFDFFESTERKSLLHKDVLEETEIRLPENENLLENHAVIARVPENERNHLSSCYLGLIQEFHDDRFGRNLILKAGCMELIVMVLRHCVQAKSSDGHAIPRTKSWVHIEKAVEYIQRCDLKEKLDNETVAEAIGVSTNYLTNIFQTYLGISLHKYILNIRIDRAQQLLLSGKVNITEAAGQTGFSSIHVFSKTFKNILGISPSQFINETISSEITAGYNHRDLI